MDNENACRNIIEVKRCIYEEDEEVSEGILDGEVMRITPSTRRPRRLPASVFVTR
jgi:hypothetical protein